MAFKLGVFCICMFTLLNLRKRWPPTSIKPSPYST